GPVLIVDEESGEERLRWRMREVLNGMGLSGQTPPVYHVSMAGFNPCDDNDLAWLIETTKANGVRLVIIDALADISLGRNENSVGEMQPVFHALRQVVEATGCSILLIHHSNKLGQYRGTTALLAAVDVAVEAKLARDGVITLRTEKNRDGGAFSLTLEAVFKPGEFSWKQSETAPNAREAIMRYLAANGPATSEQIAGETGYAVGTVWNALTALMRAGKVERADANGKVYYSSATHYSRGT
ncbi:MAG: AAA family ATPase, partial [Anaerolineales bacterium]